MLMQAILIGIVTFVCYANPMVGSLNWLRPIVCGSLTGLVLGGSADRMLLSVQR